MLVICPKCAASYNVPDAKIPEGGARTKCASCGTGFRIEKVPQDLAAPSSDDPFADAASRGANSDVSDLFGSSDDLGHDASAGGEDLTPTLVFDPNQSDRRGPRLASGVADKRPAAPSPDYPDFDWPDPAENALPGMTALGHASADPAADPFSASLFQPALDEAVGRQLLDQKPTRMATGGVNVRRPISKQRRAITFYLLMALIAGGGGYVALNIDRYAGIDWQEMYFSAFEVMGWPSPRPVPKPIVIGAVVKKVYEESTLTGEKLLVVEGLVQNQSETVQEQLAAVVAFRDDEGTEITSVTVYAGNVLSSIQLKTLPLTQVLAMHQRVLGTALNNTNVASQASLPFQAIFVPMPEERSKITVQGYCAQAPAPPRPRVLPALPAGEDRAAEPASAVALIPATAVAEPVTVAVPDPVTRP